MAELNNLRDVPPLGYRYMERATGHRFEATSYVELISLVVLHRQYKGLPTETVDHDVQDQMCLSLDLRYCHPLPGETYQPVKDLSHGLHTEMALSANATITSFVKGGFRFCEPEEAERRAAICRSCPFNKPSSGCTCHAVYRLIEATIPKARMHPGISVCMACGCSLQAKVNLPAETVTASQPHGVVFPEWCWQRPLATSP